MLCACPCVLRPRTGLWRDQTDTKPMTICNQLEVMIG